MSRKGDAIRRAAALVERDYSNVGVDSGPGLGDTGGYCTATALNVAGADERFVARHLGMPVRTWNRSCRSGTQSGRMLRRAADAADREGVTPKTPTQQEQPTRKPVKKTRPKKVKVTQPADTGRKQPGPVQGPRCVPVTGPTTARPKTARAPINWHLGSWAAAIGVLFALGLVLRLVGAVAPVVGAVAAFVWDWLPVLLCALGAAVAVGVGWPTVRDASERSVGQRVVSVARRVDAFTRAPAAPEPVALPVREPIAIAPVPESDVQEWINRGLRNRRIDGYAALPVERVRD